MAQNPRKFLETLDLNAPLTLAGAAGSSGQALVSQGAGNTPIWQSISSGAGGSLNYAQTVGTKVNVPLASTYPYTIVSVTITTSGNPVLVTVSGDAENQSAGTWGRAQLYRGTTAIGNDIQYEGSAASENSPYSVHVIDTPSAGTYTYNFKVTTQSGGGFNYGENTGPVISAIELTSVLPNTAITLNGAAPQIALTNSTANQIKMSSSGLASPTFTSYSAGAKLITFDNITSSSAGHAIGTESGAMWFGVSDTTNGFKWYGGTTLAATLLGNGALTTIGNISAPVYISTVAQGTAPFTVTSNTVVTNLNSQLHNGYGTATTATANTVAVRDSSGNLTANVATFTNANVSGYVNGSGVLYIGPTSFTQTSVTTAPAAVLTASGINYAQVAMINSTNSGSSDFAAYGDNGTDASGWVDMGFTGSNFSDTNYTITGKNDGYVFANAVTGTGLTGSLVLATGSGGSAKDIVFATGGFLSVNEKMRLVNSTGTLAIKTGTTSSSTTTGALVVTGGAGISGALYVGGAVNATSFTGSASGLTSIPTANLNGLITNSQLANTSVTVNGSSVALGSSITVTATPTDGTVTDAKIVSGGLAQSSVSGLTTALSGKAALSGGNSFTGTQTISTAADANKGLVVKANSATQSAALQEWQNNSSSVLANVSSTGDFTTIGTVTANAVSAYQGPFTVSTPATSSGVSNTITIQTGNAAAANSGAITITTGNTASSSAGAQSGNFTIATGNGTSSQANSGTITIQTGVGSGSSGNSGSIGIDSGAKSGAGTAGAIYIGATNAPTISVGHTGATITMAGTVSVTGNVSATNLTSTYLYTPISNNTVASTSTALGAMSGAAFAKNPTLLSGYTYLLDLVLFVQTTIGSGTGSAFALGWNTGGGSGTIGGNVNLLATAGLATLTTSSTTITSLEVSNFTSTTLVSSPTGTQFHKISAKGIVRTGNVAAFTIYPTLSMTNGSAPVSASITTLVGSYYQLTPLSSASADVTQGGVWA
jgi:hypothetical protein